MWSKQKLTSYLSILQTILCFEAFYRVLRTTIVGREKFLYLRKILTVFQVYIILTRHNIRTIFYDFGMPTQTETLNKKKLCQHLHC